MTLISNETQIAGLVYQTIPVLIFFRSVSFLSIVRDTA